MKLTGRKSKGIKTLMKLYNIFIQKVLPLYGHYFPEKEVKVTTKT